MKIQIIKKENTISADFIRFHIVPQKASYQLLLKILSLNKRVEELIFRQLIKRAGFGDSDAGIGFLYESDLDDYDKQVGQACIPKDCVELYDEHEGLEYLIKEEEFLAICIVYYDAIGKTDWSDQLKAQMKTNSEE